MLALIRNTFNERIRSKTFYVVGIIGMIIMLLITTGNGNLTINGRKVTGFEQMVPVALSIMGFVSSLLAVMVSLQTIPNEFERKTTHLVLIRGIKPWQYMFSLTAGNMLASVFCMLSLYVSLLIFTAAHGKTGLFLPTFLCVAIMSINTMLLSAAVSVMSIKLPVYITGIFGLIIYVMGILHGVLETLAGTTQGLGRVLADAALFIVPDFSAVQQQASNALTWAPLDPKPLFVSLLQLYIILSLTFVVFRKEV
jgi:ABC-type transport system involved in multi-copper enzyme maturation permease subunit